MAGKSYKVIAFCVFFWAQSALATQPSIVGIYSCVSGRSVSPRVLLHEFSVREVLTQENYKDGYDATYYFTTKGSDIGYAEKGGAPGIIFAGNIYPINQAKRLLATTSAPTQFSADLAEWSMVKDATGKYLCVSFNFDGIGRSGSFQAIRAAYLLPIQPPQKKKNLFYVVADISKYNFGSKH